MKRAIIEIDENLCDGCGDCVLSCAEGAIQIINGKARVVKDEYCDGLGACIGHCHVDALKIVEREAPAFDEAAAMEHVRALATPQPPAQTRTPVKKEAPLPHLGGGCPGSRMRVLEKEDKGASPASPQGEHLPAQINPSALTQWPVQLHLVPPSAPYFEGRELCVMSTCGPLASGDIHWRFLKGRGVVVACPKLDRTEPYVDKLAAIVSSNNIPRILVVRMEVPCCGGLTYMVQEAVSRGGAAVEVHEVVLSVDGSVKTSRPL